MIEIAPSARISPLADIEDSVRGTRIVFGEGVVVDAFVKVKPAGGSGDIVVGARSIINSGCVFYTGNGVVIGEDCAIAANCTFAPANHAVGRADLPVNRQGFAPSKGGIVLGNDVWIGANCVLLDGARLGEGAVVGAGSVVRGVVEPYAIVAGNPLRVLGRRGDEQKR